MILDNVSIKHVQNNRIFDLKSTFQDSISQNNTHNCQYFEELELNNKLRSLETNQSVFYPSTFKVFQVNLMNLKLF